MESWTLANSAMMETESIPTDARLSASWNLDTAAHLVPIVSNSVEMELLMFLSEKLVMMEITDLETDAPPAACSKLDSIALLSDKIALTPPLIVEMESRIPERLAMMEMFSASMDVTRFVKLNLDGDAFITDLLATFSAEMETSTSTKSATTITKLTEMDAQAHAQLNQPSTLAILLFLLQSVLHSAEMEFTMDLKPAMMEIKSQGMGAPTVWLIQNGSAQHME